MRQLVHLAKRAARKQEIWLVVGITLLAACLRFYGLDQWPPGLYHDEAYNGLDALRVLRGEWPLYFEANNGREPLFIYVVAASVGLLGRSPGAIRVAAALLGTLTVPATYLMAKALFGQRVGLLAGTLVALTFWPLNLSRLGFRAVAMPLVSAFAIWGLAQGIRRKGWGYWALGGAFIGLGLYTYLAFRMTALAWGATLIYLALLRRPRPSWRHLGIWLGMALVVSTPLLAYAASRPEAFLGRAAQTSIWSPAIGGGHPWQALAKQSVRAALMFFYRGDFIPRHNLPLRPVFDPLMASFFVAGVVRCLAYWRQRACLFLLGWTAIMLLPTVLAEGAPHFVRAVGVLPVALVFPALGLDWAWRWGVRRGLPAARWAIVVVIAMSGAWTGWDYFGRHVASEATYYNFEAGAAQLAAEVNSFLGEGWDGKGLRVPKPETTLPTQAFLERRLWEGWASLPFLVSSERLGIWSPEETPQITAADEVMVVAWPYENYGAAVSLFPPQALIQAREGARERGDLEPESRLLYVTYTARAKPDHVPENVSERFQQGITLDGYEASLATPKRLVLRLYWQAEERVPGRWTVFVHVWRDGAMNGQDDRQPAQGHYPTDAWRPGDHVLDEHTIELDFPFDPKQDQVWVGMYDPGTGLRLPVADSDGASVRDYVALQQLSTREEQ